MSNVEQPTSSDADAPLPLTIEEARDRAMYVEETREWSYFSIRRRKA
jgi:hypothetical protein